MSELSIVTSAAVKRAAILFLAGTLWSIAACSEATTATRRAGPAASLTVISGDEQIGIVGQELPEAIVARVVDASGTPVQGQIVNFHVTAGGGSVFAGSSISNADGIVKERWTLGTQAEVEQAVEARAVDNSTGEAIVFKTFHATGVAADPVRLTIVGQPSESVVTGGTLATQPKVGFVDQYNNFSHRAGVEVSASVSSPTGGRTLTGNTTVTSDASGVAAFTDLGVRGSQGPITLSFTSPGLQGATSNTITVQAAAAMRLVIASGPHFTGEIGATVTTLRVIVVDADDNPVSGVAVEFTAAPGNGSIAPKNLISDENGAAEALWTLPDVPGDYTVTASAPALGLASVTFTATAVEPVMATRISHRAP